MTNILDKDGDCIWLVNKFRTLQDTMQTIIIESKDHLGDQVVTVNLKIGKL
nr:DUF4931 domain-containing protein [Ligilactobacillus salivarius]